MMHDIIVVQNQFGVKAIHRFQYSRDLTLEEYFEALNGQGPNKGMRSHLTMSMTARDAICIDGVWTRCDSFGWSPMTDEEVNIMIMNIIHGTWER